MGVVSRYWAFSNSRLRSPPALRPQSLWSSNGLSPWKRPRWRALLNTQASALGLKRKGVCFHSFRHTVIGRLEDAGLSEGEAARIAGHASKGITYGVYSKGPGLAILKGNIEKLRYDDVPALTR